MSPAEWAAREREGQAPIRPADVRDLSLPKTGAVLRFRNGRPSELLVAGNDTVDVALLRDVYAACERITTLPDLRPAISEALEAIARLQRRRTNAPRAQKEPNR